MTDVNETPGTGPNKFLPTLGMELVTANPKLPSTRPGSPPAPAGTRAAGTGAAPPMSKSHPPDLMFVAEGQDRASAQGLEEYLAYCESTEASDLHLSPGHAPIVRIDGELRRISGREPLTAQDTETLCNGLLNSGQHAALAETGSADGALSSPRGVRYRYNVFRRQEKKAIILRRLEDRFRSLAELGLPEELYRLADLPDGLVVFSGPTGCGKSTTLATLLDRINRERRCHIVTIEDPVEYLHEPKLAEVNQKELYTDVPDFNSALVAALREDPDVILVGEVRDLKTIRTAITAAETGHLVFTTVHAGDCAGTIERIVGVFPADEQDGLRRQLALVLRVIVNQQLVPTTKRDQNRRGRVAAAEVLVNTTAISNLIISSKSNLISNCIETGRSAGMQTMDQDVARLWVAGMIDEATAVGTCRNVGQMRERARFLRGER